MREARAHTQLAEGRRATESPGESSDHALHFHKEQRENDMNHRVTLLASFEFKIANKNKGKKKKETEISALGYKS